MATKFKVWVDTPSAGTNVQSMSDFSSDSQRQNGFAAGNAASAIRVNTALREATLITTAIMDTIAPNSNVDVTSTVAQVKSAIATAFSNNKCINTITWNNSTFFLTFLFTDGTSTTVDMSGIKNSTTMYGATRDGSGNVITSTYLTQTNAANTYLTQTNAASTYLTQVNAASTYATNTYVNGQIQSLETQISQLSNVPLYMHEGVYIDVPTGPSQSNSYKVNILTTKDDTGITRGTQYNFNNFIDKFKILSIYYISTQLSMPAFIIYNGSMTGVFGLDYLSIDMSDADNWKAIEDIIPFQSYASSVAIRWDNSSTIKTFANYYEPTDQLMPI